MNETNNIIFCILVFGRSFDKQPSKHQTLPKTKPIFVTRAKHFLEWLMIGIDFQKSVYLKLHKRKKSFEINQAVYMKSDFNFRLLKTHVVFTYSFSFRRSWLIFEFYWFLWYHIKRRWLTFEELASWKIHNQN